MERFSLEKAVFNFEKRYQISDPRNESFLPLLGDWDLKVNPWDRIVGNHFPTATPHRSHKIRKFNEATDSFHCTYLQSTYTSTIYLLGLFTIQQLLKAF